MAKKHDWDRIEIEYRANKLSIREIGRLHNVSESAIRKKAKEGEWQRDLAKKVQERTHEKIATKPARKLTDDDEEVIEEIADRNATVVETHRSDIKQGRNTAKVLMEELLDCTSNLKLLQNIIEQAADEEEWPAQRRQAVNRAVSLGNRVTILKDLTTAMKTLQGLERTAFGIDGKENDELSYEERLRNLLGENN